MSTPPLGLDYLLAPTDRATFLAKHWEQAPLVLQRHEPAYYERLLDGGSLDRVLARASGSPASSVELLRNGHVVSCPPGDEPARWQAAYQQGYTIRVMGVHRQWAPLSELCRAVQGELGCPVKANLYCTPPVSAATRQHSDTHDVFVVQVAGRKRWRVLESVPPLPLPNGPILRFERTRTERRPVRASSLPEPSPTSDRGTWHDLVLEPGDSLYLPRGIVHQVWTEEHPSVHVTVGIHAITLMDLLAVALGQVANQDIRFRRSLPIGATTGLVTGGALGEMFQSLVDALSTQVNLSTALDELAARFLSASRTDAGTALMRQTGRAASVSPDTDVRWWPGAVLRRTESAPPMDHLAVRQRKLIVARLTSVRWSSGRMLIVAPSRRLIAVSDPRVLTVLQAFASPRAVTDVTAERPELPASFLAICVAVLTEQGVLVVAGTGPDTGDMEPLQPGGEPGGDSVTGLAAEIATVTRTIARDARALRPFLEQMPVIGERCDVGAQLGQARDLLFALAADLERMRPQHLEQQLRRLTLLRARHERKLHLGCGRSRLDGWVNVDYSAADLAMDLTWRLPFDDGSIAYVYIAHVLEHFEYPLEARALVREIHRVLAPGGVVRVVVPDIRQCIMAYARGDESFFARRAELLPEQPPRETPLEHFLHYAGAGARPHAFWGHRFGYDLQTLSLLLTGAGFAQVVPSDYMQSDHPALRVDHASLAAGYRHGDQSYSLFVEATKAPHGSSSESVRS